MRKHLFIVLISFFLSFAKGADRFFAQNISINSTGVANSSSSMLEVLQTSATSGTSGFFVKHSGSPATAYGMWVEMTGTPTNKYAIVVPSGSGNVGIGTITPAASLEIGGNPNNAIRTSYLNISANNAAVSDRPYFRGTTSHLVINGGGTTSGGDIYLNYTGDGTTGSVRIRENLYVMNTGNVGVGTSSPLSLFHSTGNLTVGAGVAAGAIGNAQITTGGASPISNRLTYGTDGTGWKFAIAKNQGGVVTEQMTIQDNGNVGIGTTTPAYTLDLNSGTFGYGVTSSRTEYRNDAGLQGNAGAQSGFYQTAAPAPSADWPTSTASATPGFDASGNATSWWHLIDSRHSNTGNNYALQIAGSFFDQKLFYRKTNGSATTSWTEILTTSSSGIATPRSQVFLTNGTFNVTAGTSVMVTMCGGGGGGGGGGSGGTTQNSGGGGGGGAECYNSFLVAVTNTETWTITVGAAGTAGALNTNGGAGGTTTIVGSISGTILSASGGSGGVKGGASSSNTFVYGGGGGAGGGAGAGGGGAGGDYSGGPVEPTAGGSVSPSCSYSPGAGGGGGEYNNNYGFYGAAGGNVTPKTGGSATYYYYGGGGGGASLLGAGGNGAGSGNAGWTAGAGSGNGAGGGGGCGSAGAYGGTSKAGGAGSAGKVIIYY